MMMDIQKFPTLKFLRLLRNDAEGGFSIGINEYVTVFKVFQSGIGIGHLKALKRTLKLLFVKNEMQAIRFNHLFEFVVDDYQSIIDSIAEYTQTLETINIDTENDPETSGEPDNNTGTPIDAAGDLLPDISTTEDTNEEENDPLEKPDTTDNEIAEGGDEYALPKFNKRLFSYSFQNQPIEKKRHRHHYFPASIRELTQGFRYLRLKSQITRASEQINLEATIKDICRNNFFLEPTYKSQKINRTKLTFLIDCSKSMVPFLPLVEDIRSASERVLGINEVYFDNFPNQYLYHDANRRKAIGIDNFLSLADANSFYIMVSDAGAARRTINEFRITQTLNFINRLCRNTKHFIWLNPVPKERWKENTAHVFKSLNVPMFTVDVWNFWKSIDFLRHKY